MRGSGVDGGLGALVRRVLHAPALGLAATAASGTALVLRFKDEDPFLRLDFMIYHQALQSLAAGQSVYAYRQHDIGLGFTYPPFAALVLYPLTWLTEQTAALVWLVASTVISAVFCRLFLRLVPARALPVGPWLLVAGLLWSVPVYLTLRIGQINGLVWLLVLVDVLLVLAGRRGGYLAGVAAAIKLTPLGIVLLFVGLRRLDAVGRLVAAFAACTALAALWHPTMSRAYWTSVLWRTGRVGTTDSGYNNSLWRLTSTAPLPASATQVLGALVALAVAVATIVGCAWAARSGRPLLAAGVGGVAPGLLSPVTWSHHLYLVLLLPFAVLAEPALRNRPGWRGWRYPLTVLALLPVFEVGDVGQNTVLCEVRAALLVAVVLAVGIVGAVALRRGDGADAAPAAPPAPRVIDLRSAPEPARTPSTRPPA